MESCHWAQLRRMPRTADRLNRPSVGAVWLPGVCDVGTPWARDADCRIGSPSIGPQPRHREELPRRRALSGIGAQRSRSSSLSSELSGSRCTDYEPAGSYNFPSCLLSAVKFRHLQANRPAAPPLLYTVCRRHGRATAEMTATKSGVEPPHSIPLWSAGIHSRFLPIAPGSSVRAYAALQNPAYRGTRVTGILPRFLV